MSATETICIRCEDGFSAVKRLAVALDAALSNGSAVKIQIHTLKKTRPTGFREKTLSSDILKGALELFKPCLENNPQIEIECIES